MKTILFMIAYALISSVIIGMLTVGLVCKLYGIILLMPNNDLFDIFEVGFMAYCIVLCIWYIFKINKFIKL